jgi:hypothetical protein
VSTVCELAIIIITVIKQRALQGTMAMEPTSAICWLGGLGRVSYTLPNFSVLIGRMEIMMMKLPQSELKVSPHKKHM